MRSIIRYFAFLLSALILFLGLLWVLVSDNRQGWHDKISRTCVIYDWPAREDDGVVGRFQANVAKFRIARHSIRRTGTTTAVGDIEGEVETAAEEIEAVSSN